MKNSIKTIGLLACLLMYNFVFGQQQGLVEGKIKDEHNRALPYANISVFVADSLVTGAISNKKGHFGFKIKKGTYTLKINFVGYKIQQENITVDHFPFNLSTIVLSPDVTLLKGATVEASALKSDFNKNTLTITSEMAQKAVTSEDLFKALPFVRVGKQTHDLEVEGKPALLLINGQRVLAENPLLQLPSADKIKKIEVISSPSVKYANDNVSKVVNVVLKQNQRGYDGTIVSEIPIPIDDNFSSFSYARFGSWLGKVHLFSTYRYTGVYKNMEERTTRTLADQDYLYTYNNQPDNRYEFNKHSVMGGADYFINERNLINITGRYQASDMHLAKHMRLQESNHDMLFNSYDISSVLNYPKFNEYNILGYYKHIFGRNNQTLSLDANYFNFENIANTNYIDKNNLTNTSTDRTEHTTDTKHSKKVSLSYTLPIAKGNNFEAGVYYYGQHMDNSHTNSYLNQNNSLNYQENRWASYVSWEKKFERFALRLGANYEQSDIEVNEHITNTHTSLFPKINLMYQWRKHHRFGLSLERKIKRPNRTQLNPFVYTINESTISTGNPYLAPAYGDGLTFRYAYGSEMVNILLSATYGKANNDIAFVMYTNAAGQKVASYANMLNSEFWTFNLEPEFEFLDGDLVVAPYLDLEHISYAGETSETVYNNKGWHANYGGWLEWYVGNLMLSYDCTFSNYNIKPQGKSKLGSTSFIELSSVFLRNKLEVALGYAWKMQKNEYIYHYNNIHETTSIHAPSTFSLSLTYSFSKNRGKRGHHAKMESENGQKYLNR